MREAITHQSANPIFRQTGADVTIAATAQSPPYQRGI